MPSAALPARRLRVQRQQLRVVVEHLLEVRDRPGAVDAVAEEAAVEMVAQAAQRHLLQREVQRVVQLTAPFQVAALGHGLQQRRLRKLGSAAEAAVDRVVAAVSLLGDFLDQGLQAVAVERAGLAARLLEVAQGLQQAVVLAADLVAVVAEPGVHLLQHLAEGWHTVAPFPGEIGAGVKWNLPHGVEEHGQRPAAAAPRQHLVRQLVDAVEVGALLAVHLYIDVKRVHQRGGGLVLERLVRHDVAPVTGAVADRQQDRPVRFARFAQRLLVPGLPVDRVFGVLPQVETALVAKPVHLAYAATGRPQNGF